MQKTVQDPRPDSSNRRDFIKKSATAAATVAAVNQFKTPVYGQSQAPSSGRVLGANDRVNVGFIGIGPNIGKEHFENFVKNAGTYNSSIVGACDLFNKRRDWAKTTGNLKDADVTAEYRKLLDRKDVDAILIATHDVWHGKLSIDAMEAGKHVYCEKPMTRYLGEAFQVYDVVKKTGRIYQVGSQGCSALGWHKAAEMIRAGKIGVPVWAQGFYCRNKPKGEWNYTIEKETLPENIDWDTWLGPVSKRPFSGEFFHRWRKFYPFCAGLLGDLAPHRLHPLMLATGNPEFPKRVACIGTSNVFPDKLAEPGTPARDVPEHQQVIAEFPSGMLITVTCSSVSEKSPGFVIYGSKASLEIGNMGERIKMVPERDYAEEVDPEDVTGLQPETVPNHERNWLDSIRANKPANANAELAIRVQTVVSLAEISERLKIACLFDEKTRKITNDAGKEITPMTYGWTTPNLS
jgi:predicted dehydrogenase